MTTVTGASPNDRYGDEVLNANWLPEMRLPSAEMHTAHSQPRRHVAASFPAERDVDEFMRCLYRAQE